MNDGVKFSDMSRHEDLDDLYMKICAALDEAGPQHGELYLSRLALLLVGEMHDKATVERLIAEAKGGA